MRVSKVVGEELDLLEDTDALQGVLFADDRGHLIGDLDIPGQGDAILNGDVKVVEGQIEIIGEFHRGADGKSHGLLLGQFLATQGRGNGMGGRHLPLFG